MNLVLSENITKLEHLRNIQMKKIISPLISLIFIVFSTGAYAIETKYFAPNTRKHISYLSLESSYILLKEIRYSTFELWKPLEQGLLYVSFNNQYEEHQIILDRIKMSLFVMNINSEILHIYPISSKGIQIKFNDRNILVSENIENIDFIRINEIRTKKVTITPDESVCKIIGVDDYRELAATSNLPKNSLISVSVVNDKFHIMS